MKSGLIKGTAAVAGALATSAFAATTGAAGEGSGPLVWFFIGFGALILIVQAVPAITLFASMIKGIFSHSDKEVTLPKA